MPRLRPPSKEDSLLLPSYPELPAACIHTPASDAEFAAARLALLGQSALGFDTESKPLFHVNQIDTGPHLVQLATPQAAWLLQLHHPQAVALAREIVAHPGICKVGFGLDNDKSSLPQRLGVALQNVVDLDATFKRHGYGASTGVRAAVALVLGQNFQKSKKQSTSNWANTQLSPAQVRYAANDAHAPATVYAALPAWEARQPPLPARMARPPRQQAVKMKVEASPATAPAHTGCETDTCRHGVPEHPAGAAPVDRRPHSTTTTVTAPPASPPTSHSRAHNPRRAALFQAPRPPSDSR